MRDFVNQAVKPTTSKWPCEPYKEGEKIWFKYTEGHLKKGRIEGVWINNPCYQVMEYVGVWPFCKIVDFHFCLSHDLVAKTKKELIEKLAPNPPSEPESAQNSHNYFDVGVADAYKENGDFVFILQDPDSMVLRDNDEIYLSLDKPLRVKEANPGKVKCRNVSRVSEDFVLNNIWEVKKVRVYSE